MKRWRLLLAVVLTAGLAGALVWTMLRAPAAEAPVPGEAGRAAGDGEPLRLGLVPERDIFEQRQRHRVLAAYLSQRLGRPVKLVTFSTYSGVLDDFEQGTVDAAFLGSLITVLVHERYGARVLVKPEYADGSSSYRGVLFVRDDGPIASLDDLHGHCVAMVRGTMAGHLFPLTVLDGVEYGSIRACWLGSHDEAVAAVARGQIVAGAAKDRRLDVFEAANPDVSLRRLAVSASVPENALVTSAALDEAVADALVEALLGLAQTPSGQAVLEAFGVRRFVACEMRSYAPVYELSEALRERWPSLGIQGPPPVREAGDREQGEP